MASISPYSIQTSLLFLSSFDKLPDLNSTDVGSVCYVGEHTYLSRGTSWEIIEDLSSSNPDNFDESTRELVPKICSRCGAPIKKNSCTCEYCGTSYF